MNKEVKDTPEDISNLILNNIDDLCSLLMLKGDVINAISEGHLRYLQVRLNDKDYCLIYATCINKYVGVHLIHN